MEVVVDNTAETNEKPRAQGPTTPRNPLSKSRLAQTTINPMNIYCKVTSSIILDNGTIFRCNLLLHSMSKYPERS